MAANGEVQSGSSVETQPGTGNALLGTFPFMLFGIVCTLFNTLPSYYTVQLTVAFCLIVFLGLVIGLVKNFPIWAYSFLGWSIVMTWWWTMMPLDTFSGRYNVETHSQLIGWRSWLILLCTIGIGLALARSADPLRRMARGIAEDWTLLSFMSYAFVAFTQLIYDENHHPLLVVFILSSTLVISLGAWFYLRNSSTWKKLVSLLAGFVFAYLISYICYATWDWAAYYGFPESPPQAWYVILRNTIGILLIWSTILFWPAIIGLIQRSSRKNGTV